MLLLPIRSFWLMNSTVGRLLAEKDLRAITVQATRHGGDVYTQVREHLHIEMGEVGKVEGEQQQMAVRDQVGFDELKFM